MMTEAGAIKHAAECYPEYHWDDAYRLVGTSSYIVVTYSDPDVAVSTNGNASNLLRVQQRHPNAG